jgi:uncharacterized protein (UPF0147 family)
MTKNKKILEIIDEVSSLNNKKITNHKQINKNIQRVAYEKINLLKDKKKYVHLITN